jgi:hypothetical protein
MNEAQLSQHIIKYMLHHGTLAIKMSDRFHAGIPDIYYGTGCWIETKQHSCAKHFSPYRLLRPDQHRWMNKLLREGNTCHVLIGVNFEAGLGYWLTAYEDLVEMPVTYADCEANLEVCLSQLSR